MQGASARVYIYFDDTVIGDVAEVQLVDKDGDIIASAGERVFTKTPVSYTHLDVYKRQLRDL